MGKNVILAHGSAAHFGRADAGRAPVTETEVIQTPHATVVLGEVGQASSRRHHRSHRILARLFACMVQHVWYDSKTSQAGNSTPLVIRHGTSPSVKLVDINIICVYALLVRSRRLPHGRIGCVRELRARAY